MKKAKFRRYEEGEIHTRFNKIISSLTDEQFWAYTKLWFDEDYILDIMKNWDTETKLQAIKDMNKIKRIK